tara:strand:- start:271 stop:648 length:378 start_codon:yes stop_codon:yes gene_type:complete
MTSFGTLKADTLTHSTAGSLATNFVVEGSAKSWIKYNGTGTIAISDSFNVASITDETTGTTTVTFTGAMGNANYSIKGQNSDGSLSLQVVDTNQATSAYRQRTLDGSAQLADDNAVYGDIHGDLA